LAKVLSKKKRIFIILILLVAVVGFLIYISIPIVNDPIRNFDYLWQSFDRYYSNFECKDIDWKELYSCYRDKVTPRTTNHELYEIMVDLLKHLNDKHVYIHKFNQVYFSGYELSILSYMFLPSDSGISSIMVGWIMELATSIYRRCARKRKRQKRQ